MLQYIDINTLEKKFSAGVFAVPQAVMIVIVHAGKVQRCLGNLVGGAIIYLKIVHLIGINTSVHMYKFFHE